MATPSPAASGRKPLRLVAAGTAAVLTLEVRGMPARLDLTDQRQPTGRLTARSINPEESRRRGRPCWNCDCACGGKTVVTATAFYTGHTRSCNKCQQRERRRRCFYTGSQVKDRKEYLSAKAAAKLLDVDRTTLYLWSDPNFGCQWLGGEVLLRTQLPIGNNRQAHHWLKDDLDRIAAARAACPRVPTLPGAVHVNEAAANAGISSSAIYQRLRRVGGSTRKQTGRAADFAPRLRAYVPTKYREVLLDPRELPVMPADRMTVKAAAKRLNCSTSNVYRFYIPEGKLIRGGRWPVAVRSKGKSYQAREVDTVTLASVEAFERSEVAQPVAPPLPADRMTVKAAALELGCDKTTVRRYIATKKLTRARMSPARTPGRRTVRGGQSFHTRHLVTVTAESVRRLAARLRGTPRPAEEPPAPVVPATSTATAQTPKRNKGGRPLGSRDPDVVRREKEMLEGWDRGEFGDNKAKAGRAFGFDRGNASKLINAHMRAAKTRRKSV